ncbi:MAG: hypothetical protein ACRCWF_06455 [Beijerinckiaceae bacterium]
MISGRDALASIEQVIAKARNSETALDSSLRSAEEQAARLRAERASAFQQLARIRLDSFAQDGVVQQLDHAERRALDMVKDHTAQLKQLASTRATLFNGVQASETNRHGKAATLEQALAGLESVKQAAQPKIRASAAWKAQEGRIAAARKVVEEADKKASVSEADREEKRKPYEQDPLFMYLWKAKFAQAEYDAGFMTRFFDRMIAKKVGYPDARANYAMLNEIPLRLREHAERCRALVEKEQLGLVKAESDALKEMGAGDLVAKVETARQALIGAEKDLSGKKEALAEFETRTAVAAEDPAYVNAVAILAEADSQQDIRELYAEAARTRTKDDERAVSQIEKIDAKLAQAEGEIESIRAEARDMARRRADVERERDHFRKRGYDNPYGGFRNESILGQVLGGILQGSIQGSILRDTLRDGYRQRENPWGSGPTTPVPDWTHSPPQSSGSWVPPWLDNNSSGGGSWLPGGSGGGDSGSWGGDSGGGGDGFSTGGDV